jgi:hypothetical protein
MTTPCGQCGQTVPLRRGRCAGCGAAVDVREIVRHQRRAAALHLIGEEWYWWLGEIIALTLVGLVVAEVIPVWTLAMAAVLLLRAASRLVLQFVRGALEQLPG